MKWCLTVSLRSLQTSRWWDAQQLLWSWTARAGKSTTTSEWPAAARSSVFCKSLWINYLQELRAAKGEHAVSVMCWCVIDYSSRFCIKGKPPDGWKHQVVGPIQQNQCSLTAFLTFSQDSPPHKNGAEQPTITSAYDSLQKIGRPAPKGAEPPIALSVSIEVVVLLSTIGFYNMCNWMIQSGPTKIDKLW